MTHNLNDIPTYKRALVQIVAYRVIQSRVNELLRTYDLITTQWIILGYLNEHQKAWQFSEIANLLHVENPLVSRLMQPLLDEKLISVQVPEADKRAKLAEITDKGKVLVSELEPKLAAHLEPLTVHVGEVSMTQYFNVLNKIANNEHIVNQVN